MFGTIPLKGSQASTFHFLHQRPLLLTEELPPELVCYELEG